MSHFDKLVANWVSSASSRPRQEREDMLKNINKNLETYRDLENPSETVARKRAEQKRIADEARKIEEEEKRKAEEKKKQQAEERRKEQEARRASLPPLPPSATLKNTTAASSQKRVRSKPLTTKKGGETPRTSNAGPETPIISEREKARLNAQRLAVRDVDYKFEDDVSAALEKLCSGSSGPLLCSEEEQRQQQQQLQARPSVTKASAQRKSHSAKGKRSSAAPTPRDKKASVSRNATAKAGKRTENEKAIASGSPDSLRSPEEPPATPVTPAAANPAEAAAVAERSTRSNTAANVEEVSTTSNNDTLSSTMARAKPPALAMIEQDNDDAELFRQDETHEKRVMELFRFGAKDGVHSEEDDDEVPEFSATHQDHSQDDLPIPDDVDAMRRADQRKRPSRMGISDASVNLEEARIADFPPTPKSRDKVKVITKVLERHYLFSFLDDSEISKFASIMDLEKFEAGREILTRGEGNDTMFLILDGEVEAVVKGTGGAEDEVLPLGKGATFGDVGLMYESKNTMTVTAKTHTQCASLERKTYKMVTSRSMTERRERYTQFLASVPFFCDLPQEDLTRVAEALKAATFTEGDRVISRGAAGEWLYFVLEGTLAVRGGDGETIATVRKGGMVGHVEFLFHHVAAADVVAVSPAVRTAKLSRYHFDRLVSSARDPMIKDVEESDDFKHYREVMKSSDAPAKDVSPSFDTPTPPPTAAT